MSVSVSDREAPPRRVRHEARDALAVAAFSAGASTTLAVLLTVVITRLG